MSGSQARGINPGEFDMASFWLPPHTTGNGLQAQHWALITTTTEGHAAHLLGALARAGVAARTAPAHSRVAAGFDVWVDSGHYAAAENVLLRESPRAGDAV